MKNVILLVAVLLLSACAGKFDAKKLDLRKDCTGDETNKTLSDMFCKKKLKCTENEIIRPVNESVVKRRD